MFRNAKETQNFTIKSINKNKRKSFKNPLDWKIHLAWMILTLVFMAGWDQL